MKKYSLAFLLLFSFAFMGQAAEKKLKIVTSFTIIADMAANVAGDNAEVVSITKPNTEIHQYQPTPKDIAAVQDADLILWNGLNLELWFERFLQDTGDTPSVILSENIEVLSIGGGEYAGKANPHGWMSPQNGLIYVENIRKALVALDPENAQSYNENAKAYSLKIEELQKNLYTSLKDVPPKQRYLATSEGAFSYLAKDMGFKELYIWPVNADQQGSSKQIRHVIDSIRQNNIPAIFSESTISDKPAKQVAKETKILYGGVLYVDSLPVGGTYLSLLEQTIKTITQAFEKAGVINE